jgi:hypothetical protein
MYLFLLHVVCIRRFFFHPIVGVEVPIVNALYLLVTNHGSAVWILRFTRVVRSQSTVEGLLQVEILKNTQYNVFDLKYWVGIPYMTVSRIVSGPMHETAVAAGKDLGRRSNREYFQ